MRLVWMTWLLSGCFLFEPTETGAGAMVGRLVTDRGVPVRGVEVRSLEARDITDGGGDFAVAIKAPNRHVDFAWEGANWQQRLRESDYGGLTRIRLPPIRPLAMACVDVPDCQLILSWKLEDGLSAQTRSRCAPGPATTPLLGVPQATPTAVCRHSGAKPDTAVHVEDRGDSLVIRPAARELTLSIHPTREVPCEFVLAGRVAGHGQSVSATIHGKATAGASCDGTPAIPMLVTEEATSVTLEWKPGRAEFTAPAVDGEPRLLALDGPLVGIAAVVPRDESNVILPIGLPAGRYRVQSGATAMMASLPEGETPGVVMLRPTADGWLGILELEAPLEPGKLSVTMVEP